MLQTFNEANRDILININGDLLHRDKAGVSPFDSLVQGGDGVWEGLRLYRGKIFKLHEHLERLRNSAKALAFDSVPETDELIRQIARTLEANYMHNGVHIRLTLSRGTKITSGMDPRLNQSGPTLIVLAEFKEPVYDKNGLNLVTSSLRRFPPDCMDPKIHHNNLIQSIMAKVEANASNADDAIMLDPRGFLAETNATNVFIVSNGKVETSRTVACPEGITRATVLDLCRINDIPCTERDISMAEVYAADEAFCTGTMGELAAIAKVDGRWIGDSKLRHDDPNTPSTGPVTSRISVLFRKLTEQEGVQVVD